MGLRFAEGSSARRARSGPRIALETTTEIAAAVGEDGWKANRCCVTALRDSGCTIVE